MKSYGQLWDRIVSEENFLEGWQCFRRNHPSDPFVVKYAADVRRNLEIVRRKVADGSWKPSNYHQFKVYEPKPRIISCVPVRDRMVHHALCNVIAPLMEARFVDHSYACRTGKGAHAACNVSTRGCFARVELRRRAHLEPRIIWRRAHSEPRSMAGRAGPGAPQSQAIREPCARDCGRDGARPSKPTANQPRISLKQ